MRYGCVLGSVPRLQKDRLAFGNGISADWGVRNKTRAQVEVEAAEKRYKSMSWGPPAARVHARFEPTWSALSTPTR